MDGTTVNGSTKFQSTLPRRERHNLQSVICIDILISIHAPVKGATDIVFERDLRWGIISIHAPVKGTTCSRRASSARSNFNPRSREGSDDEHPRICKRTDDFNPRSREGSDVM